MKKPAYNHGFTLVETLIAILILSMTIGALMTLAANGFFSVRYARNDIVASSLLQESLEYVRNTRDTAIQKGETWQDWKDEYAACFSSNGCIVNTYAETPGAAVAACPSDACPYLNYYSDDTPQSLNLYGYSPSLIDPSGTAQKISTTFVRKVVMESADDDNQVVVTASMEWKNGTVTKRTEQSIILTDLFK